MNILTTLIEKFPNIYFKLEKSEYLVTELFNCIFQTPTSITKGKSKFSPKFKSRETLQAAFNLIYQIYERDDKIKMLSIEIINNQLK